MMNLSTIPADSPGAVDRRYCSEVMDPARLLPLVGDGDEASVIKQQPPNAAKKPV
jgi:hypothetical protein